MPEDLSGLTPSELLTGYARTLSELRRRDIVRSGNAPVGDYAEWLFARALEGALVPNLSTKSHDVVLRNGERLQVKARLTSNPIRPGQLQTSPFRSWDFDIAGFALFNSDDYTVKHAALVPVGTVEQLAKFRAHVNGWIVQMNGVLLDHASARDVTEDLQRAALQTTT